MTESVVRCPLAITSPEGDQLPCSSETWFARGET
jgi:hypothetical protein